LPNLNQLLVPMFAEVGITLVVVIVVTTTWYMNLQFLSKSLQFPKEHKKNLKKVKYYNTPFHNTRAIKVLISLAKY
jgi:hypothetical protein